ncbi:MAG TPA: oxygen-independent coproporphyrinogen III oxidase [Stellaceae bacterium]|nr:oxygen-independent coproporphyrinogen III oxidase [Stellaceae bacterium]
MMPFRAIDKYVNERVPRYTSYPSAPHFSAAVDANTYRDWLSRLSDSARLSLYLHIPFCRSLCWYCGCHTMVAGDRAAIDRYLAALEKEIGLVADILSSPRKVAHIHWGGGTPTIVGAEAFERVMGLLRRRFAFEPGAEVAVEIDPRCLDEAMAAALARSGVSRASLGVQSFDSRVQREVNRIQTLVRTQAAAAALRGTGIAALNVDLLYGLPHETAESCKETAAAALTLAPDRLAVFGYAHVPHLKRHQQRLDAAALPGAAERWRQERAVAETLVAAGYRRVGLDHYARPADPLARAQEEGRLRRNFQGYTDDPAEALLGFGASAIGELPQGYVQNTPRIAAWQESAEAGSLATARGIALSEEDRLRRDVIERLMCDLRVDVAEVCRRRGLKVGALDDSLARLCPLVADGLARLDGRAVTIPEEARPLLRCVAAVFDAYLEPESGRHAVAV